MKVKRQTVEMLDKNVNHRDGNSLLSTMIMQCSKMLKNFNRMMIDAGVYDTLRATTKHLMTNPILLVMCLIVAVSVAIPLSLFVLFAVINIAFAFTSFLVIEVTVLSIATAVLCCILFCIISTITAIGVCVALIYYVTRYVSSFIKGKRAGSKHVDSTPKASGSSRQGKSEKRDLETKFKESRIINGEISPVWIESMDLHDDFSTNMDSKKKKVEDHSSSTPSSDESM